MPYIKQERRDRIDELGPSVIATAGDLNYFLTRIALDYLGKKPDYQLYNDVIGALECCKLELYRRRTAAYEDVKIQENGDVY
jgi:hypothetical protein